MKYLINANFPRGYEDILSAHGTCVRLPASATIPLPTGAHPDTLVGVIGGEAFISDGDVMLAEALSKAGVRYRVSRHASGGKYPHDCALNFFTVGKHLICREDSLSPDVKEYALSAGYDLINVKQGYARCSAALVGGGVITADRGIYDAVGGVGVPRLLISAGGVSLPPYEYGFIGGACGTVDEKTVLFFGSAGAHPDGAKIRAFCRSLGVDVIEGDGELFDFGGFITLYA